MGKTKIVLYSTNCPKCKILEKKLQRAKLEFEVSNDVNVMMGKGFVSAPMLELDNGELTPLTFEEAITWIDEVSK